MKKRDLRLFSSLLLLITAMIWGLAFVAQSVSMNYIGACTFTFSRFLIGGCVLIPFIMLMDRVGKKEKRQEEAAAGCQRGEFDEHRTRAGGRSGSLAESQLDKWRKALPAGLCCGIALGAASLTQQFGIKYTTVGKAGFITTLYIIIVPLLGVFLRKRVQAKIWISAAIAVVGLYLICMSETLRINLGDALVMLCALLFAVQIMLVDHFSPKADPIRISCVQFFVAAAFAGIGMLLFEKVSWDDLLAAAAPILYAGVLSSGVGYTFQVVAQRNTDPTVASLLMSLESVFAVLAGWVMLNQSLTASELFGCALVFFAVILAQLPEGKKARSRG